MPEDEYISLDKAAAELNVKKPSLYYYIKKFNIQTENFDLDTHTYMKYADFERIKSLKDAAAQRQSKD